MQYPFIKEKKLHFFKEESGRLTQTFQCEGN